MAKIVEMKNTAVNDSDGTIVFKERLKLLPDDEQEMLKGLGVDSFEKFEDFIRMMGFDPIKMKAFAEKHGYDMDPEDIPFEDFMLDEEDNPIVGSPKAMFDDDEKEDYDNPFLLPEECFIGDKCVEYHLRVKLNNAPIPIWREFKVPSNVTLEFLAFVINDIMGWEDIHLHQFMQKDTLYKNTSCLREDEKMGFFFSRFDKRDTNDYTVAQVLKEKGDRIKYEYDFGDSWEHDLWLKGIREYASEETRGLVVVKGKGACPPEDCGGVWGYAELLEIWKKKRKTAEEKKRLEWFLMNKYFDPEEFDSKYAQKSFDELWEIAME